MLTPPICQRMENIPQALVEWEASHRTWIEAGGAGLDDHRTVGAILRLLPEEVRNRALWDYEAYQDAPEKLKAWLRDKVKLLGTWKGGAKPVHVLVGGEDGFEDAACRSCEEEFCDLASLDHTATNAQICAVFRRQFANGGAQVRDRAQTRQPPRREAPPRDLRDVQCPNCHRKGHLARDCTEPQKARDARTCFKCGKTGHLKKDCPEGQAAHALEAAPPAAPAARRIVIASLEDEDGFVPVQRQRAARARTGAEQRPPRATTSTATRPTPAAAATASTRRPAPARHTLADHFGGVFARLAKLEEEEAEAEAAGAPRRPPDPVPLNCLFTASLEPPPPVPDEGACGDRCRESGTRRAARPRRRRRIAAAEQDGKMPEMDFSSDEEEYCHQCRRTVVGRTGMTCPDCGKFGACGTIEETWLADDSDEEIPARSGPKANRLVGGALQRVDEPVIKPSE